MVGITSQLEGEEMPVSEPGFLGGDRTSIDLPQPEEDLIEAVAATGKPLAVVLANGSALAVNWINEHANPIIAQGDYTISIGGGQPDTAASVVTSHIHIDGQYALPE